MPGIQIDLDLNTAKAEAQAEVFRRQFVESVGKAADLAGDELKAFVKNAEKQYQDLARAQADAAKRAAQVEERAWRDAMKAMHEQKLEQAAAFQRTKERIEGLKMAFQQLGGEQAKAAAGALEMAEAGFKIGGPWGAGIGLVVGAIQGAIEKQAELKKAAEADFKDIASFAESAADGLRAYERGIDRIIRAGDFKAITEERIGAEEKLAQTEDKAQKIVDALQAKERALAAARGSLFTTTSELADAELALKAEYAASFDAIVKLVGAYEDQAAAVAKLKAAEAGVGTGFASGVSGLFGAITGAAGAAGAAIGAGATGAQKDLDKRAREARIAAQEAADADAMMRRLVAAQDAKIEAELAAEEKERLDEAYALRQRDIDQYQHLNETIQGYAASASAAFEALAANAAPSLHVIADTLREIEVAAVDALQGAAVSGVEAFINAVVSAEQPLRAMGKAFFDSVKGFSASEGAKLIIMSIVDFARATREFIALNPISGGLWLKQAGTELASGLALGGAAVIAGKIGGALGGRGGGAGGGASGGGGGSSGSRGGGSSGLGRSADRGPEQLAPVVINYYSTSLVPPKGREAVEHATALADLLSTGRRGGWRQH